MNNNKRTVLLTGASRGIGKAIRGKLEEEGYLLITPSRGELDLSDEQSVSIYINKLRSQKIDILINNAGINQPQYLGELDKKNIEDTLRINLITPIYLANSVVGYMKKQKWGRIINVSSIFGIVARGKQVLYASSKHGINGMTRALALELAPFNILVNSVCPGFTLTDLTGRNSPRKNAEIAGDIPLGRFAFAAEIAELVSFLVSEKNTYITGSVLPIDGGFIAK